MFSNAVFKPFFRNSIISVFGLGTEKTQLADSLKEIINSPLKQAHSEHCVIMFFHDGENVPVFVDIEVKK